MEFILFWLLIYLRTMKNNRVIMLRHRSWHSLLKAWFNEYFWRSFGKYWFYWSVINKIFVVYVTFIFVFSLPSTVKANLVVVIWRSANSVIMFQKSLLNFWRFTQFFRIRTIFSQNVYTVKLPSIWCSTELWKMKINLVTSF